MTQRIQNSDVTTPEKLAEFTTNVVASVWHTSAQAAPWGPLWSQLVAEEVPSANPKLLLDSAPLLHAIASGPEPSSWLRLHRDGLDGEVLVWARRGGLDPSQVRPTDTDMWEVYREIQAGLRPTPPEDTQEKAPDRAGRKMHPHRR